VAVAVVAVVAKKSPGVSSVFQRGCGSKVGGLFAIVVGRKTELLLAKGSKEYWWMMMQGLLSGQQKHHHHNRQQSSVLSISSRPLFDYFFFHSPRGPGKQNVDGSNNARQRHCGHRRRGLTVGMGRVMMLGIALLIVQVGFKGHAGAAAKDGIAGEERSARVRSSRHFGGGTGARYSNTYVNDPRSIARGPQHLLLI
jgi:hypothetical protein